MMSVLLADDERLERTFLRKILEQHAELYTVIGEAANGLQAVELALRYKPDIAILDISMPELNGLEAGRKLKAMNPDIIIVLNSAYAEFQFAQKALEYKLDAYLVKPSNEHDILATMMSLKSHGDTSRARHLAIDEYRETAYEGGTLPHGILEAMLRGVAQKNTGVVIDSIRHLESSLSDHDDDPAYRLFAINLVFSVDRTLQTEGIPAELLNLLDSSSVLRNLGTTEDHGIVYSELSPYLSRLVLLLEGMLHTGRTRQQILDRMVAFVDDHFHEDIHLEDLANQVFLSPAYVSRLFHTKTGTSLARYIHLKRAGLARDLLDKSDLSVKEISHHCGYRSISHFYRSFERVTGQNPGSYRRKGG
ncbi:MAG: response regulator [Clostridia bacterium]